MPKKKPVLDELMMVVELRPYIEGPGELVHPRKVFSIRLRDEDIGKLKKAAHKLECNLQQLCNAVLRAATDAILEN